MYAAKITLSAFLVITLSAMYRDNIALRIKSCDYVFLKMFLIVNFYLNVVDYFTISSTILFVYEHYWSVGLFRYLSGLSII